MAKEYIISAVGGNRPGVVAELTKPMYQSGINIENSNMTLLAEHFTLIIHIFVQDDGVLDLLADKLQELEQQTEIATRILPVPATPVSEEAEGAKPRFALRVRGDDRTGIVYKTSSFLSQRGVNILEMKTQVEKKPQRESPLFQMYTLLEIPESVDREKFRNDLENLANELQESITLTKASSEG